jgi:hypothetical protein
MLRFRPTLTQLKKYAGTVTPRYVKTENFKIVLDSKTGELYFPQIKK